MNRFDVLIVGAGIAGASLAWRLAGRRSVLLVEREARPGVHSTGRSAALFMESYGPPGVRALTRASRDFYLQPPAGFADVPVVLPRGVIYVAQPGQQQAMDALRAELAPTCPGLADLSAAEVCKRLPCLRPQQVIGGLLDPEAMDLDVDALHQGFLRGARARGVVLRVNADVQSAQRDAKGDWQVTLGDGAGVSAGIVVNAAGAWADQLAAVFGAAPIGLVPHRRSAFTFAPPEGVDVSAWPAAASVDEGWYFKPDAGRLLGSPANADPTVPHDVMPEEIDIATGIHEIESVTTMTIRRPSSTWAGLRSFVSDGELVIGFDEACPGFFWLAAQGGYGIQSAAGASALAMDLLVAQPLSDELVREGVDPAMFAPGRLR